MMLVNTSDRVLVVKWSESAFSFGSYYGIPFLAGMKYIDAGNPSATPDTILAPGTAVTIGIFPAIVQLVANEWDTLAMYVSSDIGLSASLVLKVVDEYNQVSYVTAPAPDIWLDIDGLIANEKVEIIFDN